jgi:hypothetical protein
VIDDLSVCYRSAWESVRPGEKLETFVAGNPYFTSGDWPFRGIFDQPGMTPSDHYGLLVEFAAAEGRTAG